jgi:hypothetical protein
MSEKTMAATFVLLTKALDPRRVENMLSIGTPDVNLTTGWVELKWCRSWPASGGPLRLDHFTDEQRRWLQRRWDAGGGAWLVLQVRQEWFVFNAPECHQVGHLTHDELIACASAYFQQKPSPDLMTACLRRY